MSHLTKLLENAGLCVVLVISPAIARAQSAQNSGATTTLTAGDRKFLNEAADGGMTEVELGKLAVHKAADENVRNFGQHMIDDHGKANDKIRELAVSKGIELPNALSAKSRNLKKSLAGLSGAAFDRAYMTDMVTDHKEDVAAFQKESNLAHDPQVKSFATETLPTLHQHLKSAQEIAAKTSAASSKANLPLGGVIQNASGKPSPSTPLSAKPGSKLGSLLH